MTSLATTRSPSSVSVPQDTAAELAAGMLAAASAVVMGGVAASALAMAPLGMESKV